MEKFTEFIERHVAPVAGRLGANRYIQAIQNTFLTLIPFMTIGSMALVIVTPPMDYTTMDPGIAQSFMQGWQAVADFLAFPLLSSTPSQPDVSRFGFPWDWRFPVTSLQDELVPSRCA